MRIFGYDWQQAGPAFIGRWKMKPELQELQHLELSLNKVGLLKSTVGSVNEIPDTHIIRNGSAFVELNIKALTFMASKMEVRRYKDAFVAFMLES